MLNHSLHEVFEAVLLFYESVWRDHVKIILVLALGGLRGEQNEYFIVNINVKILCSGLEYSRFLIKYLIYLYR